MAKLVVLKIFWYEKYITFILVKVKSFISWSRFLSSTNCKSWYKFNGAEENNKKGNRISTVIQWLKRKSVGSVSQF